MKKVEGMGMILMNQITWMMSGIIIKITRPYLQLLR